MGIIAGVAAAGIAASAAGALSSSGDSTATQTNSLDPASQAAVNQKNSQNTAAWNNAQNVVASNPTYPSYPGSLTQNFTPDQISAMQLTDQTLGTGQSQLQAGTALTGQAAQSYGQAGGQPFQANAVTSSTMPQNYQSYMSPYINSALNASASQMERVGQENQVANHNTAVQAGAYGGERQGVQDAMNNYNTQVGIGNMYSQGLQQAVTQAGQQFTADQGQSLNAQESNNATALAGYQANAGQFDTDQTRMLNAGQQLAAQGQQAQTMNQNDIGNLQKSGALQQQQGQNAINAQYNQFQLQQQQPYVNQALLNQTNGAIVPAISGGTTTQTTPGPNALTTLGGLTTAGASIYGQYAAGVKEGGPIDFGGIMSRPKKLRPALRS